MPLLAVLIGALLVVLGLLGYYQPDRLGEIGEKGTSPTALIPAGIGAILALMGILALLKPAAKKHFMHLAALVGLLGAIGGVMPLMRSKFDFKMASAMSGLFTILLCALFVVMCIRSFVVARIARAEGLPDKPASL